MSDAVLEAFERCQRRYPTIRLSFEVFRARMDEILSGEKHLQEENARREIFEHIHHEDLFLAIACSYEDRVAWEYFADDFLPIIRQFASQACGNSGESEDLAQEIAAKLIREKHRLAGYNGKGSLAGWLRVAVSHAAIDRFRRMRKQVSLDELQEKGVPPPQDNPGGRDEEENLDARWGPVVSRVANEIISRLSARDRMLLGLYYLRDVPLKTIGRQFGIHEATASRWLEKLRRDIRRQVERELRKKHGLRVSEIRSLWRWISIPSVVNPIVESSAPASRTTLGNTGGSEQKNSARRID